MSDSTLPGRPLAPGTKPQPWQTTVQRLAARLGDRTMVPIWLTLIVLAAALFRFTGLNWDQNIHHHPDERFLTDVVSGIGWPSSVQEYLDEARSPLNPRNVLAGEPPNQYNKFSFWVYGDLALTLVKGAAVLMDKVAPPTIGSWQDYEHNFKVGRVVNGLADLGTLLVLFALARRLYKDSRVALLAATLYSVTVLPIQHAHFWVVDNLTTFFVTVTLFWLVRIFDTDDAGFVSDYVLAGLFFGIAMATKVSIATLAVLFAAVGAIKLAQAWRATGDVPQALFEGLVLRLGLAALTALLAFRIFQPYAFSGPVTLAPRWLANLREVQGQISGEADPPWGFQWANRVRLLFPWKNQVLWGMGLPLGLAAWAAWAVAAWQVVRQQRWLHALPVLWVAVLFLHQGNQWVMSMRYLLPLYPMLVLLAAWGLVALWERAQRSAVELRRGGLLAWTPRRAGLLVALVVGGTLLYALAFMNIYRNPHTHIQAARWIHEHVPQGSVVAFEHYDEGVPLSLPDAVLWGRIQPGLPRTESETGETRYDGQLEWYFEDSPDKLIRALGWLDSADYIVTVSNRLYGSTWRLPARYPMTNNYYEALFNGELGFQRVADITEGPSLLGLELDDQFSRSGPGFLGLPWDEWLAAEEAFTVYDHPRVQIFAKTEGYDRDRAQALLSEGVDWNNISRLTAKQWTEQGGTAQKSLLLTPSERATYAARGSWPVMFDRDALANRLPLLFWIAAVELLGLLALPFLALVGRGLPERGLALARTLGLLLVGWLAWLLASLRVVPFALVGIALALGLVALGGAALAWWLARSEGGLRPLGLLRVAWARHGRAWLLSSALFWGAFALVLAVRWANPDLWHPALGGEKPMDLAYLNATLKSSYFPPMDPWFAGGYINYYYFGFVLVATLIKLTGIVPEVAYNLALPTLFAMLASGVWSVALALLVPLKGDAPPALPKGALAFATLAALFVCVLGNLGELRVLLETLPQLSPLPFRSALPGVETAVKAADGLLRGMLLNGQPLPGRMEWPYWTPTRTIPDTINEFPWFTFLYADLHAHMMALPLTVLVVGLGLAWLRLPRTASRGTAALTLGLAALALGALWPTNTWDLPTYALLLFAALGLRVWRRDGTITARGVVEALALWLLVVVAARLFFQPYHSAYAAAYTAVERWQGKRTGLGDFLTIHGLFLWAIGGALLADLLYGRGHNGAVRRARFRLRHMWRWRRASRALAALRPSLASQVVGYGALALALLALLAMPLGFAVPGLILLLLLLTLLLFFRTVPEPLWQMVLFFVLLGLGLTLAVEGVVLKGDIGRMNTVFKFYLQVWVLWGIAAAIGAARVAQWLPRWLPEWRWIWRVGFTLLFSIAMLYPIFATYAKINDRFDRTLGPGLNGMAFMERATFAAGPEGGSPSTFSLAPDGAAIRWMQESVGGSPTIAEMNSYPTLYGWGNRYSIWTGNPAIVGWDWHQRQQRAAARPEQVAQRIGEVRLLYDTPDPAVAAEILQRYSVKYVIVGPLERAFALPEGIAKFEAAQGAQWDLVYENPDVKIYRVRQ